MTPKNMDDVHGETAVAQIKITMARSGNCKVEGSITDHEFAKFMLQTALDVVANYHNRAKMIAGGGIMVPAYDTALVGTEAEKKLLAARHELANAMGEKRA